MELDELEELHRKKLATTPVEEADEEEFGLEEQALMDIQEAILILTTAKTLIDYLADPDLTKTITKRERASLGKVSEKVRRFLATIEPTYNDEEEG